MRICSFLPSATEIVCTLGLADSLVGITHQCDYPAEVSDKPRVVTGTVENGLSSAEIEERVRESVRTQTPIYRVDIEKLRALKPDVILTQGLCNVCALDSDTVFGIADVLECGPEVVSLDPRDIESVFDAVKTVGEATGTGFKAEEIVRKLRERVEKVRKVFEKDRGRPRVFCMEWMDPPYAAGHWIPEMVEIAGGENGLAKTGERSKKVSWEEIGDFAPNIVVLMPCGFGIEKTVSESARLSAADRWRTLPAVRKGEVYVVDSNSYFTRPSPRIADGIEIMAGIIHPDIFRAQRPAGAVLNLRNHTLMESFLG